MFKHTDEGFMRFVSACLHTGAAATAVSAQEPAELGVSFLTITALTVVRLYFRPRPKIRESYNVNLFVHCCSDQTKSICSVITTS